METYTDIEDARKAHGQRGGFLLDLSGTETIAGDCFAVTDDSPGEYRDFKTTREAIDYTLRLAKAGYDETRMGNGEPPYYSTCHCGRPIPDEIPGIGAIEFCSEGCRR